MVWAVGNLGLIYRLPDGGEWGDGLSQGISGPTLPPEVEESDLHLCRPHFSLFSRAEMPKTIICENSESHRPEPTRREVIKTWSSEEAGGPSARSDSVRNVFRHHRNGGLQLPPRPPAEDWSTKTLSGHISDGEDGARCPWPERGERHNARSPQVNFILFLLAFLYGISQSHGLNG